MPVSQDSSFINDYSEVKEQVIMVIEYLQQIKDSYFEQKHALEKQLNLLEIQLKETVETPVEQSAAEPEMEEIPSKTETVQVFKDMVEQAAKEEKSEEKPEEKQF